ncbi:MAG: cyanophycin synthetase, partial [Hyphomonas sp.]|nr:cyanophycin synthetase [Hyphomonas sp.]
FILPTDDEFFDYLAGRARRLCPTGKLESFGRSADATAREVGYETDGNQSRIQLDIVGKPVLVTINAVGEHWAMNAAAAVLAASQSGLSVEDCAVALTGYTPPPGRGAAEQLKLPQGGYFTLIDDAYNANPASMRASLAALMRRGTGRRLIALGEMLEIGETSDAEHAALAGPVSETGPAALFLAGDKMTHLSDSLPPQLEQTWASNWEELWKPLQNVLRDGDVLLIKGSNASGMAKLADRIRQWSESATGKMERGAEGAAEVG